MEMPIFDIWRERERERDVHYLKGLPHLNSSLHCNKHNLQPSMLFRLIIWEKIKSRLHGNGSRTVYVIQNLVHTTKGLKNISNKSTIDIFI